MSREPLRRAFGYAQGKPLLQGEREKKTFFTLAVNGQRSTVNGQTATLITLAVNAQRPTPNGP
jgi:hypothetical protein